MVLDGVFAAHAVEEIVCATCAGCVSTLLGHPLDTIKVHLQTNHGLRSTSSAARSLLQQNAGNPVVFFRGIGPPLANAILMNTVMFTVFRLVKDSLPTGAPGVFMAGVVSGLATAFLSTPVDLIKIQAQLTGQTAASVFRAALQQGRRNPAVLFRGHTANLCREGSFTLLYLGLYDLSKTSHHRHPDESLGLLRVAAVSSLTGGLAWVACYPFDTIKTVMQGSRLDSSSSSATITFRDTARGLWREGGYNAFFKGCGASTGRAMLVTSTRMIAYESVRNIFFGGK